METPEEYGFYKTNIGVLYFEDVWVSPSEYNPWEPVTQEEVTDWVDFKEDTRHKIEVRWNLSKTQLQAPLWWAGSLSKSKQHEGLFYWTICSGLKGYANSKEDAQDIIERLIKSDRLYNYSIL